MGDRPLTLLSTHVVLPDGPRAAAVVAEAGRIRAIAEHGERSGHVVDLGDLVLMPGLVDTHVHVNEPGRTEWEGFQTATRAAAAGGVTTLVDMPLNSIPATTDVASLHRKIEAARTRCWVDCGFWGGVVPGNAEHLEPLLDAGALGFKCFLCDPGVPEFAAVGRRDLETAMPILARRGATLLVHAEDPARLGPPPQSPCRRYADYLRTRPPEAERAAIEMLVELARRHGAAVHVVHLAAAEALPAIETARADAVRLTVETCPHYLLFEAGRIPDGATLLKCAPPIRGAPDRAALWDALRRGAVDMVVSDHSPCPPQRKALSSGDLAEAWGGIASLQLGLSLMWTEGAGRGAGWADLARWMGAAPARLAGLGGVKGIIAVGADADLVVVDPEARFTVEPEALHHRHRLTPYTGRSLRGVVRQTYLRGQLVYDQGTFGPAPTGRLLTGHR